VAIVAGALARGELPSGTEVVAVIKALLAPNLPAPALTCDPIDEATADRAVEGALAAARSGALLEG
jgi:hypothetical protein